MQSIDERLRAHSLDELLRQRGLSNGPKPKNPCPRCGGVSQRVRRVVKHDFNSCLECGHTFNFTDKRLD